jgi:hypothetical protein
MIDFTLAEILTGLDLSANETDHPRDIMDVPAGASMSDDRWQLGYDHAGTERPPESDDPIYISGWCHGYCGSTQCSAEESIAAYHREKPKR